MDLKASRNALKKIKSNKHAAAFLQPVDPIRDHAPKLVDVHLRLPCSNDD